MSNQSDERTPFIKRERGDVGEVGVDSGQILIIDPRNLDHIKNKEDLYLGDNERAKQLDFPGYVGAGVVIQTGFGDGFYTVEIETVTVDDDQKVTEIKIKIFDYP